MMRRALVLLALTAILVPFANAADTPTSANFLRAYVNALCAEKSGDHDKAVELMTPYVMLGGPQMRAAAKDTRQGLYSDASVQASWALVSNTWAAPSYRFAVGKRDRKEAVAALQACFGSSIAEGPKNGQSQVDNGAALLGYFLTRDLESFNEPRWNPPPRH